MRRGVAAGGEPVARPRSRSLSQIDVFARCLAKVKGDVSGDAFWYQAEGERVWSFIADGLGHGPEAAKPSQAAVETIRDSFEKRSPDFQPDTHLRDMLMRVDRVLHGTRGAAVGLAVVDATRREGFFAGVGNIVLRVVGLDGIAHPISMPGIAGVNLRKIRVERFPYAAGSLVVMHSDGLSSRFDIDPREAVRSPLTDLGETLLHKHAANDDVTLLLLRQKS